MVRPLWDIVYWLLYKSNIELPCDPATPLPVTDTHPKNENRCSNKNLYTNVHSNTIHNGQKVKQLNCPLTDEWISN